MGELTWDYLGHGGGPYCDETWTITLITKINMASNILHKRTHQGGGNKISLHPSLLPLFEVNRYFRRFDDGTLKLSGRYEILLDETLPKNKILVSVENEMLKKAKDGDYVVCVKAITIEDKDELNKFFHRDMSEIQIRILKKDSEELANAFNDSEEIVLTEDKLIEEIEILNYVY